MAQKNCQDWVKDFVNRLVEMKCLGEEAIAVVEAAPRFYVP